ncbi:MAG: hypothetical protein K6F92_00975 [Lachnospiraceae bacterium]|nr:hypothetical protein [Lachnospiraceae bacterium]
MTTNGQVSEFRNLLTQQIFKNAYASFIEQADKNYISGKGSGSRTPAGFSVRPEYYGKRLSQHFGQGAASRTPYMNWWVLSIYYLPDDGRIIMGVEEGRYSRLADMQPKRYEYIGSKKIKVAVFYETTKADLNYDELYEAFVNTAEDIVEYGLEE